MTKTEKANEALYRAMHRALFAANTVEANPEYMRELGQLAEKIRRGLPPPRKTEKDTQ